MIWHDVRCACDGNKAEGRERRKGGARSRHREGASETWGRWRRGNCRQRTRTSQILCHCRRPAVRLVLRTWVLTGSASASCAPRRRAGSLLPPTKSTHFCDLEAIGPLIYFGPMNTREEYSWGKRTGRKMSKDHSSSRI